MQKEKPNEKVLAMVANVFGVDRRARESICALCVGPNPGKRTAAQHSCSGSTGAQPEGAFFNFINWIGNVVAPVGAGGAVFAGIIGYVSGRGAGRWLLAAAALLAVSGLTRLLEFWVLQGVGGVS
jgi:hypothetical protein